ncbi:MAG: thioredoxin [Planctomyces sp.]
MSAVHHTSTASFAHDVLNSPVPVLVDFYADWCGPCRMLAPALDRLATEFSGKARIVKVNLDQNPQLASEFNVQAIPTLAFVVQGKVVGQSAGAPPEATLRRVLNQLTSAA